MLDRMKSTSALLLPSLLLGLLVSGCSKDEEPKTSVVNTLVTSSWVPNVTGASASNHGTTTEITKTVLTGRAKVTGMAQPAGADREVSVSFSVSSDLDTYGSVTLMARVVNYPSNLSGSAWPMLVSLSDGTDDLVSTRRAGTGSDCAAAGYFSCSGSSCGYDQSGCTTTIDSVGGSVTAPSAYISRQQWIQHQAPDTGRISTNTFPNCNWTNATVGAREKCYFNSNNSANGGVTHGGFFSGGKLRQGTYTAKYVVIADSYISLNTGTYYADIEVTVVKKKDSGTGSRAVDLNVIMVGSKNIADAATAKGQQNLNALFNHVYAHYNASSPGPGVKLGTINAYDWDLPDHGDQYANLDVNYLGKLLAAGSAVVPADTEGKALNVFLVSTLPCSTCTGGGTVLGIAGTIRGPLINGTGASGLAFSSFDELATANPSCNGTGTCAVTSQTNDFRDMGATISHEIGHYLGLNHPSEGVSTSALSGQDHIPDTPVVHNASSSVNLSHNMCLSSSQQASTGFTCGQNTTYCSNYDSNPVGGVTLCPLVEECQFNHMMWYTGKNYESGTTNGDGVMFSTQSSAVMKYNPFIW
ncbi:MAG: hypothetical protein AB7F66_02555 [Bacteriovoracia bacterium]